MQEKIPPRLVKRVQNGDVNACNILVERCAARVKNVLYRLTGNPEDTKDLAQEVFIKMVDNIGQCDIHKFDAWLYRICINTAYNYFYSRTARRKRETTSDAFPEFADTSRENNPYFKLEMSELNAKIDGALDSLELDHRIPFVLFHISGLSIKEIAESMDLNEEIIRKRTHRARRKLRKYLKAYINE
jgi:RNA polymerase sigma-70 factor (ECF subfamily)